MLNVLSLFDGMSCARIALDKLNVPCRYYASEIDKYAIKVAKENYPQTIHMGSVTDLSWNDKHLHDHLQPKIDLLIGGSPCQGFSFAGHQLNFGDPRSKLFFEYVRILKETKPKYFLLENVRMAKKSQDVISAALGVEPVAINSNLMSAQNRYRLYWTNIPFEIPEDKGIVLADILEDGMTDRVKAHCLDANYYKGGNLKSYFEKHRRQLVFSTDGLCHVGDADLKGHDAIKRVYHPDGKSPTLTTMQGGHREPKVLISPANIVGRRLNVQGVRKDNDKSLPIVQYLEVSPNKKTRCLSTVQKDTLVTDLPVGKYPNAYTDAMKLKWRKLTPLECERLQTVPDGYTEGVSNTQRYKMLGNSFTVDVIAHILKDLTHTNNSSSLIRKEN